ncbi:MAG TPA: PD-(D/E)XK nuclease family transposase, partial [Chitinophagales bacterium]|nr:PD-(D/E)XK nuclease family transposase [Chitinophagales bacterium]
NFGILEGFLSELLKEDIKIEGLLESESNKDAESEKFNRVDLYAENENGEHIIIEIQNTRELDYLMRMLFGASKAVTEYLPAGAKYADVKKIIAVSIVYFDLGKGDDYIYIGETKFVGLHTKTELQLTPAQIKLLGKPTVEQAYPRYYLIRTTKFNDVIKDTLDEWIYFLKNSEVLPDFKAKGMTEVKEKLNLLNLPEPERRQYKQFLERLHDEASYAATIKIEQEQALEEAVGKAIETTRQEERKRAEQAIETTRQEERKRAEQAIETTRQEERNQQKVEIALKLLKTDMPDATIAAITGLSETDIALLRTKL